MAAAGSNVRCINYYDLCRICTDSTDHKTNIYSPEGRAKNLSQKILECLSLQIDEKDRLPKVVCAQCVQLVEQIHGLRATCRNSQTMLNNCLNIRPAPSSDKLYIRDAVDETGKSLSVAQAAPQVPNGAQQSGNLLNSIIQAVNMQPQQQYTITMDNGVQQQQQHQAMPEVQIKSERQTALEEFIRLKPDIKITPLGKKEPITPAKPQQQHSLQSQTVTPAINPSQLQLQPQLGEQLQPLWQQIQQLQLQQQLQQLTNQLQATTQYSVAQDDTSSSGDSKKPKLNFVLSSPTAPQFTTSMPQFGGSQPQIQLQLMPGSGGVTSAGTVPAQTQLNAAALLSSLAGPQSTTNLLSPNKCFLPITIRDENSDQQIVAHIDTKNLVLPTTYQVQMKLQPQLATADGQPIMQLTPTSIPATLQLTPQTLGNPGSAFQGTTVAQNQFLAPQQPPQQQPLTQLPNTAQVTSQQIIRSPHTSTTNSQLVIRNVTNIPTTPTTPTSSKEAPTFKTPSPKQKPMPSPKSKNTVGPPSGGSNGPSTNEFKRLITQTKPQPQVKQQQAAGLSASGAPKATSANQAAMQRLSSNTTITKVPKQPASLPAPAPTSNPAKLPMLNKQNITISRISMQTAPKPQSKPSTTAPTPASQPIPVSVPALSQAQPPPLAAQHKKIVRKPPEDQEMSGQKVKASRPPQQILPSPQQEGQNATPSGSEASTTSGLICPTCKREFKKKEHLTQHVKLHAGLRPFKCSEEGCDKTFSRKEHLSRHLVSHSGQKMYTCEVCKKPFSRKDNLNKHRRIHTQTSTETLYCCDVCNKNFATKLHYEKHREMHKKIRPESATPGAAAPPAAAPALTHVRSNGQVPNKAVFEIKQEHSAQRPQQAQTQQQPAQVMHVVTTQDLAGNTITITQAPDSNMPASLANYVQLGFSQFQNPSASAAK
ncbi:transcription factor Sp2 [Drosophila sechellia]|uniref:transcription factor Sp2 n=1 Tax=Drosophila sechellia TaxID=7238 RepID=UPI0013DDCCEA|nr:transcription factor Sp2 [Drosophila sechellia]